MFTTILSIVVVVAGFGAVAALALVPAWGHKDRDAEEAAREFFDRTGRWPDETAS